MKLSPDHTALVIYDVFKGQMTEAEFSLLEENNIIAVTIPPNCTDRLQPLDMSVNKPVKEILRRQFQLWYSDKVSAQLEENPECEVDLRKGTTAAPKSPVIPKSLSG